MNDYLYDVVCELLHVEEGTTNKLIDLYARDISKTYFLHNEDNPLLGEYVLSFIKERIGRAASTVLKNSSLDSSCEQLIGGNLNVFDWKCANGVKDVSSLHAFIADIYKELSNKGNNPLFLSVGALKWTAPVGNSDGKPLVKEV